MPKSSTPPQKRATKKPTTKTGKTTPPKNSTKSQPKKKKAATAQPAEKAQPRTAVPLTPAQQEFREKMEACSPQEQDFVRHKLARLNNTQAAIKAGYSERTAEEQGARLLARVRVHEAFQAGLRASGFSELEVLDDIRALRTFDRSQIEREVKEQVSLLVERRADAVVEELLARERVTSDALDAVDEEEDPELHRTLKARLRSLLRERLLLQEELAVDPEAMTIRREERLVTKRVIDYDLARERGLLRFIKGVKPTKYGDVIEVHDWVTGVDMAARAHGLFKDRKVLENPDGSPVQSGPATVIVLPGNGRGDAS